MGDEFGMAKAAWNLKALDAIITKAKEHSMQIGAIDCPCCGNVLNYTYAGPRAIQAKCLTDECVEFLV